MPLTAGLVIAGVSGGLKWWNGQQQTKQGEALAAGNVRPKYNIQKGYYDNQGLAENQAQSGLGAAALAYSQRQADRGLAYGVDATLQAGGSINNLGKLYDQYDVNNANTAARDAELKTAHLQQLIEANKDLAGQQTQQWAINEYEPYKDTAKLSSQLKSDGMVNEQNGLSSIGSALSSYGTSQLYKSALKGNSNPGPNTGYTAENVKGVQDISAASDAINANPSNMNSTLPADHPFNTTGGQAALQKMASDNPNSPYLQMMMGGQYRRPYAYE